MKLIMISFMYLSVYKSFILGISGNIERSVEKGEIA